MRYGYSFIAVLVVAFCFTGCDDTQTVVQDGLEDSTLQFERARLVLAAEPADAKTPTEAKELVTESTDIVVAGRIYAGDIEPFQPGKATFMLSQLPAKGHGDDDPDHADNCPFCKRELEKAPKVIVNFHDEQGNPLDLDAQELLNVKKGDAVVVQGKAQFDEATHTINMDATGIYRRES